MKNNLIIPVDIEFADSDFENLENLLPFVSSEIKNWSVDRPSRRIILDIEGSEVDGVEEKVRRLIAKVKPLRASKDPAYLVDCSSQQVPHEADVFQLLLEKREIIQHAPGVFSLHGKFQRMFSRLDGHVRSLARKLQAEEVVYPVTISLETLRKSNFFSHYPQFANFISTLAPDLDSISAAAKALSKDGEFDFLDVLRRPSCMCRSAGCLHSYPSYENQTFRDDQEVVITMLGRIFRNEGSNIKSLERLQEYSMREIIFMGSPDFVCQGLDECLAWCRDYLMRFQLQGVVQSANDPFFADNLSALQLFQRSEQTKLECRMTVPFTGKSISVASINNHGEHFSKSYAIRFPSGKFITTGCFGVGYERLLFATISQYGYDETLWPSALREFYFPPEPRFES